MRGVISLRIDREPDFFRLLTLRGPGKVFVAIANHGIVGCVSVSYRAAFIDGQRQTVGYIDDLKVHPAWRGSRVGLKLAQTVTQYFTTQNVEVYYCLVADGNANVLPFLRARLGLPVFVSLGKLLVYGLFPSLLPVFNQSYELRLASPSDYPEVCQLGNAFNTPYQFASPLTVRALPGGATPVDIPTRLFTAHQDGRLRATLGTCDMSTVKQNVVIGLPRLLRTLVDTLRLVSQAVPLWTLPRVGQAMRLLYLQHLAYQEGHHGALRQLLQHIRHEAFRQQYAFVVLGLHERDPVRALVRRLPKLTFVSHGFVMSVSQNREVLARVTAGIPREDFTLV
jgi:hypothetical protein